MGRRGQITRAVPILLLAGAAAMLLVAGCGGGGGSDEPSADELIETIASSDDPQEREDAAVELAGLLDPAAVTELVALAPTDPEAAAGVTVVLRELGSIYRDPANRKNAETRVAAVAAIAPIDSPEAATTVIGAVRREADPAVAAAAARSLALMKKGAPTSLRRLPRGAQSQLSYSLIEVAKRDPEAVSPLWPPLVRALTDAADVDYTTQSQQQQIASSEAEILLADIAAVDLDAVRPLIQALERRDYETIANLDSFYIALGKPGSEPILAAAVAALYPTGDERYVGLPFNLLNTGNAKLTQEVKDALAGQGFTVTGSGGPTGLKWGSSGAYK